MAGFMAGFGSAFSQSFNQQRQRSHEKEQDAFKMQYTDYISRRESIEKRKREEKMQINKAKKFAEMYSNNPEAWPSIHEMIVNDIDDNAIIKHLQENEAVIEPAKASDNSGPADPRQDLTTQANGAVDAQMQESGMQPPADKGIFGNMQSPLKGVFGDRPNTNERVTNRVAEAAGVSSDEVRNTLNPQEETSPIPGSNLQVKWKPKTGASDLYKANNLNEALVSLAQAKDSGDENAIRIAQNVVDANMAADTIKAKNEAVAKGEDYTPHMAAVKENGKFIGYATPGREPGTWVDSEGRPVGGEVVPFDKTIVEDLDDITKDTAKESVEYRQAVSKFTANARNVMDMATILKANPGVMGAGGYVAKETDQFMRNIKSTVDLFKQKGSAEKLNEGDMSTLAKYEEQVEQEMQNSPIGDNFRKMALARSLLEMKAIRMAYAQAATVGQTGQGVAAREFDRFYEMMMNPNEGAWKQEANSFLQNGLANLKNQERSLNEFDPRVSTFEKKHGFPSPIKPAPSLEELLQLDPELMQGMDAMMTDSMRVDENVTNPDQVGGVSTPKSKQEYDALPPGAEYIAPDGSKRRKK